MKISFGTEMKQIFLLATGYRDIDQIVLTSYVVKEGVDAT